MLFGAFFREVSETSCGNCSLSILAFTLPLSASAACVHKYINRAERGKQNLTLLTGALTYDEAKNLAVQIEQKKAPALEWLDSDGKLIARQPGKLGVVRPMPGSCDGKSSGVVLTATFPGFASPAKVLRLRIAANVIEFLSM